MLTLFKKVKSFIVSHKIISGIVLILIIGIGYHFLKGTAATETRYVMTTATKGSVIASITGSGQVEAGDQVDLKPKGSGTVTYVSSKVGQFVRAGTLIVSLDVSDAQKNIRDVDMNLQSAQNALDKLEQPADALALLQAQNALTQAKANLKKAYEDGFNSVSDAFLQMPTIISGVNDVLHLSDASLSTSSQMNVSYYTEIARQYDSPSSSQADNNKNDAETKYTMARNAYDKNFVDYKLVSIDSDPETISALIDETYKTSREISDVVRSTTNLIQFYQDKLKDHSLTPTTKSNTHLSTLSTYMSQTNSFLNNLLNIKNTITSDLQSVPEKTESLDKLTAGPDAFDVQSAQFTITQRKEALADAKNALADYYAYAPFDGTIAKINVQKGDTVSGGTAVATIITKQKIATITLNEVDIAKIKLGQKATVTFDALPDLSLVGTVAEIDTLGTVSQGVVTYAVKISLDTDDDQVKPGMSATAAIVTDVKPDVLVVPNSTIKTNNGNNYVEMFDTPLPAPQAGIQGSPSAIPPKQVPVTTGLSNDTVTEIVSGIKEGDMIITRTITGTPAATTAASAPSLFGNTRGIGGGGALRTTTGR